MPNSTSWARLAAAYGAAALTMTVLDALWLGVLARDFYQQQLAPIAVSPIRLVPAAVFYLGYPAALIALALVPRPSRDAVALGRSALVGALAYGVYDMSNLATLRDWTLNLALLDIAWGTVASMAAGAAAWAVLRRG